jgi:hypothetical protein
MKRKLFNPAHLDPETKVHRKVIMHYALSTVETGCKCPERPKMTKEERRVSNFIARSEIYKHLEHIKLIYNH